MAVDTARSNFASEAYYRDALEDAHAYDRVYDDLLADPGLQDEVNDLTGGIAVEPEDLSGVVKQLAPPDYLRGATAPAIASLAAYLRGSEQLDLAVEVTPIIGGIHTTALGYALASIVSLPLSNEPNFVAYQRDLKQGLDDLAGVGLIPEAIPTYQLSESEQDEAARTIFTAAGIDEVSPGAEQVVASIRGSLAAGDTAAAIRTALPSLVDRLIRQSIADLTGGAYVVRTEEAGEPLYFVEPTPTATAHLARSLDPFQRAQEAATAVRPLALGALIVLLALIGLLQLPSISRALVVPGLVLLLSGAVVAAGWLLFKPALRDHVADAAVNGAPGLPAAYGQLVRDVVASAADNLAGDVWLRVALALLVGAGLVVAGAVLRRPAWPGA